MRLTFPWLSDDYVSDWARTVQPGAGKDRGAEVLPEVGGAIRPGTLVVSLCAGLVTSRIEAAMPEGTPVVRVMPNTPAQVDEGMAAVSAGSHASPEHLAQVQEEAKEVVSAALGG